jgi:hypothetical protein
MSRSRAAQASRGRFRRSSILSNPDRGFTRIEDGDEFVVAFRGVVYFIRHQQPIVAFAVIPDVSSANRRLSSAALCLAVLFEVSERKT